MGRCVGRLWANMQDRFETCAYGTFAQHPERVRDHSICAAFSVALPLWIPAFAGMTGVVQTSPTGYGVLFEMGGDFRRVDASGGCG